MPDPAKKDPNAPKFLEVVVKDPDGNQWGVLLAREKVFSTGSVGYYASEKLENPTSRERYQVSLNMTLIGSKPKS